VVLCHTKGMGLGEHVGMEQGTPRRQGEGQEADRVVVGQGRLWSGLSLHPLTLHSRLQPRGA
jgi:hypothetical protein